MFEGKKIKKLLGKFTEAENQKDESQIISELKQFGKPAIQQSIEIFQQRRLSPEKSELLLENLCDDSCIEDIVPLICDSYHEVRRVAKEMIIKRWRKSSLQFLIQYINNPDLYSRNNATELLTIFKDQSCVPELVSLFNDADPDIKRNIIKILGKTGGQNAKKLIISALNDESAQVCLSAVKSLGEMKDPECVPLLIDRLTEEDPQMKRLAMDALGAIGDKRAAPQMLELLKDDDLLVRQKATEYLIEIADSNVVPDVLNLMRSEDVNIRRCAVEVLNNLKDPRTSEALMNAIKDSDWWVRQIATESLTSIKGDNIVKGFIAMTRDNDENLRRCAVEFFNKVAHKSALDPLLRLLKDKDWWVREKAVTAIGKLKEERAIAPLAELIDDEEVRWAVPVALAEIGGEKVLEPLKDFLLDEEKRVRIESIKAFGKLKAMAAVPDLKEFLKDPDEDIRNETVSAIKKITGKAVRVKEVQTPGQVSQSVASRGRVVEGAILTEAIVVLDLCNSTDMAARYGDNFALNLMKILTDIISPVAKKEGCQFMKNTGDGFLITFPKVGNSIRFALGALKEISKRNVKTDSTESIDLRFGINVGETRIKEKGDRLGIAINMAFRIEGVKPDDLIPIENGMTKEEMPLENRILITENVEKEIKNAKEIKTNLIGLFELKGITGLHKIYELTQVE